MVKWQSYIVALVATCATLAAADSITVDGETYNDVVIDQGYAVYYVQFPETGERVPIDKARVSEDAVQYTEDMQQRGKLIQQYRDTRIRKRVEEIKAEQEARRDAIADRIKARGDDLASRRAQIEEAVREQEQAADARRQEAGQRAEARGFPDTPDPVKATNVRAPRRPVVAGPAPQRTVLKSPGPQPKQAPAQRPAKAPKPAQAPKPPEASKQEAEAEAEAAAPDSTAVSEEKGQAAPAPDNGKSPAERPRRGRAGVRNEQ